LKKINGAHVGAGYAPGRVQLIGRMAAFCSAGNASSNDGKAVSGNVVRPGRRD
jgi:hypothetical protein